MSSVPPEDPAYTLRRVWLTKEQEEGYYHGLSNEGLWPLVPHHVHPPDLRSPALGDLPARSTPSSATPCSRRPAIGPPFVFIQDYHFALLPRYLKDRNPNLIVAQFWHIPWPNREVFRVFPWKEELLEGMLGNDLLGFHVRYHCQNFMDTVDRTLEARIDYEQAEIVRQNKMTLVRPFPISIDFERQSASAASPRSSRRWLDGGSRSPQQVEFLGIGIERIDYTKGIPERLRALDRFFEKYPEYRERLTFFQVGVPSRGHVPQYQTDRQRDRSPGRADQLEMERRRMAAR